MEIKELNNDGLTVRVSFHFAKEDYSEGRKKVLNRFRRNADIKGFRKGMVPMSLVEKMYGQTALVDAVNDVIAEGINNFIRENNLRVLGEPLPNEEKQKQIDWENDENYEFVFDIALSPKVEFTLDSNDKIVSYNVKVSDEAKEAYKTNMLKQFGKLENIDEVKDEESFIVADLEQGETKIEGTYVTLRQMPDQAAKDQFLGKKVGDSFEVNVNETFTNETDRAALLKVKKEELASMDPMWKFTIVEVKNYVDAVPGQELYDMLFGKDTVKTEEEFDAKIEERIRAEYAQEADFRFSKDAKTYLLEKANLTIAEKFLKRWIYVINEGKFTMEDIEKDWDLFIVDYKWQMVRGYLMDKYGVKIEEADLLASAKGFAAYQFAMYGMNNVPDEQLESFAKNILAQEEQGRRILDQVENEKTFAAVREVVTLKKKKISVDKFRELK